MHPKEWIYRIEESMMMRFGMTMGETYRYRAPGAWLRISIEKRILKEWTLLQGAGVYCSAKRLAARWAQPGVPYTYG